MLQTHTLDSDHTLVYGAKAGDQDAFAALAQRYNYLFRTISRSYFAVGTSAEDLIQEAMIGLFKAVRDFRAESGTFKPFLEICIKRQVITYIKAQTRRKHSALNGAISLDAPRFDEENKPLSAYLEAKRDVSTSNDEDEAKIFLAALRKRCSPLERNVLALYTTGYSFDEMADEVGKHLKAIDNAVWRIKIKARKLRNERTLESRSSDQSLYSLSA